MCSCPSRAIGRCPGGPDELLMVEIGRGGWSGPLAGGDRRHKQGLGPELAHDLSARSEHCDRARMQAKDLVDCAEIDVAVRNDNDGTPILLQPCKACSKRDVAFHIE